MFRTSSSILCLTLFAACSSNKGFTTYNNAPAVTILEPQEGQIFSEGEPVSLLGQVTDDSDISQLTVDWASSIDGVLPNPNPPNQDGVVEFITSNLSGGIHVITLRAVDAQNDEGKSDIQIEIEDVPDIPTIQVTSPDPNAQPPMMGIDGQEFVFSVRVADDVDTPDQLVVEMSSNPGGFVCFIVPDGSGNGSCSAQLDLGEYLLSFVVTDSDGFHATARAAFEVRDRNDIDSDGDGFSPNGGDCNDSATTIFPGAPEVCDGLDNDCDPNTEVDVNSPCYDDDGDGFCEGPPCTNATETIPDCDDSNPIINPNGEELQNNIDDDCDGLIDEGFGNYDDDGDGYCETPPCTNAAGTEQDCDDTNGQVNPAAAEVCGDGIDNNCDTLTNEQNALGCNLYFQDNDNDGYGTSAASACYCEPQYPYTGVDATDCDDTNPIVNPGQSGWFTAPLANGSYDYNCDGSASMHYTDTSNGCVAGAAFSCSGDDGWTTGLPACGQTGTYEQDCGFDLGAALLNCGGSCIVPCLSTQSGACWQCIFGQCSNGVCDVDTQGRVQECH